jgi:hypothetical protein
MGSKRWELKVRETITYLSVGNFTSSRVLIKNRSATKTMVWPGCRAGSRYAQWLSQYGRISCCNSRLFTPTWECSVFCRASLSSVSLSKFAVTKFAKSLNKTMFPKCVSDSLVSTVMRFIWISSGTHLRHLSILGTGGQPTPKHHSSVDCIYCKRWSNLVTAAGQDLLTSATNAQLGIVCC